MSDTLDRLYQLLPSIYRQRDEQAGGPGSIGPLRALLRVVAEQMEIIEADIDQLYENWFIETCQDWVVPYIGDLIGYQPVQDGGDRGDVDAMERPVHNRFLIPRREVANTIGYRRRKGTLTLLEKLARDVAGWPAYAVELDRFIATTQSLNDPRPTAGDTVDLRDMRALGRLDSPFDRFARVVDVRRISSHRTLGRHGLNNVGLFISRLRSYPVTHTDANCSEEDGDHCFTFSGLGNDTALFIRPEAADGLAESDIHLNYHGPYADPTSKW